MTAELPFMSWYPRDFQGKTTDLSPLEELAYRRLIDTYWMKGGALLDDDAKLASIARATLREWKKMKATIAAFFEVRDGVWWHERIEHEMAKARASIDRKHAHSRMMHDAKQLKRGAVKSLTRPPARAATSTAASTGVSTAARTPDSDASSIADSLLLKTKKKEEEGRKEEEHPPGDPTDPRASGARGGRSARGIVQEEADAAGVDVTLSLHDAKLVAALRSRWGKDEASRLWTGAHASPPNQDCADTIAWFVNSTGFSAT